MSFSHITLNGSFHLTPPYLDHSLRHGDNRHRVHCHWRRGRMYCDSYGAYES
jgi:hypothetical protein